MNMDAEKLGAFGFAEDEVEDQHDAAEWEAFVRFQVERGRSVFAGLVA